MFASWGYQKNKVILYNRPFCIKVGYILSQNFETLSKHRNALQVLRVHQLDLLLPTAGGPVIGKDLLGLEGKSAAETGVARGEGVLPLQVVPHVVLVT